MTAIDLFFHVLASVLAVLIGAGLPWLLYIVVSAIYAYFREQIEENQHKRALAKYRASTEADAQFKAPPWDTVLLEFSQEGQRLKLTVVKDDQFIFSAEKTLKEWAESVKRYKGPSP